MVKVIINCTYFTNMSEFRKKYEMDIESFERLLNLLKEFGFSETPEYKKLIEDYKKWLLTEKKRVTQLKSSFSP